MKRQYAFDLIIVFRFNPLILKLKVFQGEKKGKVGQSLENFFVFSWLSMQFQIAKVFPASLSTSQFEKKLLGFFLICQRDPNFFSWLLSRPCSINSNNKLKAPWSDRNWFLSIFFPTYSSLFRCWHIISLHWHNIYSYNKGN